MNPYSYTDPHNHRMQFLATTLPRGPYVSCEAENLALGGDTVIVSLPAGKARALADHLDKLAVYEFIDVSRNMLRAEPAHDWTRFTFVGDMRQDDGPSGTVPVVVLTGRLPAVARALRAQAERAEHEQYAAENRSQHCAGAAINHDETGVCDHSPAEEEACPTDFSALLAHVAAQLPTEDVDSIDSIAVTVLAETLLGEDRPTDERQATVAARYLFAHHTRELADVLGAKAGRHGAPTYDYELGPGMHAAAEQLAEYADRLDGGKRPKPVSDVSRVRPQAGHRAPRQPFPRLVDAAAQFAAVWSHQDTANATAPTLRCVELDALIGVLRAAGAIDTAIAWWMDARRRASEH
ncbi:hypothetical protein [Streptomyces lydicus]|uniref:hypothetical protein n=1 Tax=Streptomyces lydicus TaxID=47763 RepID=UPI001012D0EB|nr:hypothetical protein [Streptomyces lydicus]MCZ1012044.1 hypothetical protein [Streptomyces lydicus]